MLIYRVEDKNGTGPYASNNAEWVESIERHEMVYEAHNYLSPNHPGPLSESWFSIPQYTMPEREYIYGFDSESALKFWFNGFLEPMFEHGFFIKTYDVPPQDVIVGRRQVAFKKPKQEIQNEKVLW